MIIRNFRIGLFLGLMLVLVACESLSSAPPLPCPQPAIYSETATVIKFGVGPGRDIIDVVAEGKITGFSGGCNYNFDDETGKGLLAVELSVDFIANKGPANLDDLGKFSYFVTVADSENNVLSKGIFDVEIPFQPNRSQSAYTDENPPVNLEIPLKKGQYGDDVHILIGFQLTTEELEMNRRHKNINVGPGK